MPHTRNFGHPHGRC